MPTRLERFDAKWIAEPNTGCRLWLGGSNEHGYGVFWNGSRLEKAHRFAFKAAGFPLSDNEGLLHRCDTPACVNPAHLFAGTQQTNVDDMWAKRRATVLRRCGTAQAQAKLDDRKAAEIRSRYARGDADQYALAAAYRVSQRTIWNVLHDRNWRKPSGVTIDKGCGR